MIYSLCKHTIILNTLPIFYLFKLSVMWHHAAFHRVLPFHRFTEDSAISLANISIRSAKDALIRTGAAAISLCGVCTDHGRSRGHYCLLDWLLGHMYEHVLCFKYGEYYITRNIRNCCKEKSFECNNFPPPPASFSTFSLFSLYWWLSLAYVS